jgi:hypothetical protein
MYRREVPRFRSGGDLFKNVGKIVFYDAIINSELKGKKIQEPAL